MDTILKEDLEAQSSAFQLVANILRTDPKADWVQSLTQEGLFDEAPWASNQCDTQEGLACLRQWASGYSEDQFDAIARDFMKLFIGPEKPAASPWESVYNKTNPGMVFQQETLDVRNDYKVLGLKVENLYHEPDDHVSYEMEFVSALNAGAVAALNAGNEELARAYVDAKERFLVKHIQQWVPAWCERVLNAAETDFYRGIALLIKGFLAQADAETTVKLDDLISDESAIQAEAAAIMAQSCCVGCEHESAAKTNLES